MGTESFEFLRVEGDGHDRSEKQNVIEQHEREVGTHGKQDNWQSIEALKPWVRAGEFDHILV